MGDSIAVGVSQQRKECSAYVQSGISSPNFMKKFGDKAGTPARSVIISLGANDFKINTQEHILKLREKVKADHVFWILPNEEKKPEAVKAVQEVAKKFGDTVIPRPEGKLISKDGIHPTPQGYKDLASKTKVK
jgi:lysophospholipase L1-like esterase